MGYADDMASACPSKANIDKTLNIIDTHAKKWRYSYNAKKSAVMVYGETKREHERGSKFRNFVLNGEKVPEKKEYDHVGVRNCLFQNYMPRTEDRISRGINAVSSIGVRKKGINMATCSILYWSIIVPIVTYGSELWVMSSGKICELRKFQCYIGRRCQRFPKRTPNYSAYIPLGWMSIDRVIQVKKLLFLRTILVMKDHDVCKRILRARANDFSNNVERGRRSENSSPIYEIMSTSIQAGLYDIRMRMINNGCYLSKFEWKKLVWEKIWLMEDEDCIIMYKQPYQKYILFEITDRSYYLKWWILADLHPRKMQMCEIMARLLCDAGLLISTDYRLKGKSFSGKVCGLLCGITDELLCRLQKVQNNAVRVVSGSKKYDHITVLKDLHWLPIRKRIEFKILLLTFKCMQGCAPLYLRELLVKQANNRTFRSNTKNLLQIPLTNLKRFGDRTFCAYAPRLWNELPDNIKAADSVHNFKKQLKTLLF